MGTAASELGMRTRRRTMEPAPVHLRSGRRHRCLVLMGRTASVTGAVAVPGSGIAVRGGGGRGGRGGGGARGDNL